MNVSRFLKSFVLSSVLTVSVLFAVCVPFSCKLTEEGIEVVAGDTAPPKILQFSVSDNKSLIIICSEKVTFSDLFVCSASTGFKQEVGNVSYRENGTGVDITLIESTEVGIQYELTGVVKDDFGNSTTFSLPFLGFNDNPARMILTEIRSKHSTSSGLLKKAEFIELYVLDDGNTAGFEIISGSDGSEKKYSFPNMNVKKGEWIVIHYRKLPENDCIDETEENLSLSTAESSSDTGRDLWIDNAETRISDSDVIVLRDGGRNIICDAVLYAASDKNSWYYSEQKTLSVQAFEEDMWNGGSEVEFAAVSDNVTAVRTLARQNVNEILQKYEENKNNWPFKWPSKNDWAVVKNATPGSENNSPVFVK